MGIRSIQFLLLFLLTLSYAGAQSDSIPPATPKNPPPIFGDKNIVFGINTQFAVEGLFDQQLTTPLEVVMRLKGNRNSAWRIRALGIFNSKNSEQGGFPKEEILSEIGLAVGKEWHKYLSKKWGWYNGFELGFSKKDSIINSVLPSYIDSNGWLISVNRSESNEVFKIKPQVFLGVGFNLNKRISLSTEIGFGAVISSENDKRIDYYTANTGEDTFSQGSAISDFTIAKFNFNYFFFPKIILNFNF